MRPRNNPKDEGVEACIVPSGTWCLLALHDKPQSSYITLARGKNISLSENKMESPYVSIPKHFLGELSHLNQSAVTVFLRLCELNDGDDVVSVSTSRLAALSYIGKRTVFSALADLEAHGLITREKDGSNSQVGVYGIPFRDEDYVEWERQKKATQAARDVTPSILSRADISESTLGPEGPTELSCEKHQAGSLPQMQHSSDAEACSLSAEADAANGAQERSAGSPPVSRPATAPQSPSLNDLIAQVYSPGCNIRDLCKYLDLDEAQLRTCLEAAKIDSRVSPSMPLTFFVRVMRGVVKRLKLSKR